MYSRFFYHLQCDSAETLRPQVAINIKLATVKSRIQLINGVQNEKAIISMLSVFMLGSFINPAFADDAGPKQLPGTPGEQIQQLNSQLQAQLLQIQTTQKQQIDTLNSQLQNQIKQMQTQLQDQIQKVNAQTQDQMQKIQTTLQDQIKQVQQQLIQSKK